MHESSTVMQPDYVGKPEGLYLWCLIGESKTCRQYACPMSYFCGCDTGICITETKQSLKLETIGVHYRHSHIGGRMHARKSAPGVGGFSRPGSEASANDESGGWNWNKVSRFIDLTFPSDGEEMKSAMIDVRSVCCIPDTDSETDSFQGDCIEVGFVSDGYVHNDVVRCC